MKAGGGREESAATVTGTQGFYNNRKCVRELQALVAPKLCRRSEYVVMLVL